MTSTATAQPLSRWLLTLVVSLALLALAYAHAPDPAKYLGLSAANTSPLTGGHPAPKFRQHHPPALATQVVQPVGIGPRAQFAR